MTNKIVLCGEFLSSNLGDGVIADSLEYLIRKAEPDIVIYRMDLSGRREQTSGKQSKPIRSTKKSVASLAPRLFNVVRWAKRRIVTRSSALVASGDTKILVIGGGQLLMDNNWRFPLDLFALALDARRKQIPIVFHACGVGEQWSYVAKALVRSIFVWCDVRYVSVRDTESASRLKSLLKGVDHVPIETTADPAVWASEVYGLNARATFKLPRTQKTVGLGIMNNCKIPAASGSNEKVCLRSELTDFWVDLAQQLRRKGFSLALFTNGAQEDELFVDEIADRLNEIAPQGSFWERKRVATEPFALVRQIAEFDGIVAHRLHASIIAFSHGVPSVSLEWDSKVRSFNEAVGRSRWTVSITDLSPGYVADLIEEAVASGVCSSSINQAQQSIGVATERLLEFSFADG